MESIKDPFSVSILKKIFRTYPPTPDRLVTRESNTIEFKTNFHLGRELDRYGKTIVAFANNAGGYIIYGVTDKPRTLKGMTNKKFIDLEPHTITEYLNNKFSPEIEWEYYIHEIGTKKFGLLYICESRKKPVIAKTNGGDVFKEGDIFYRYRGRSERIKYSELWQIIEKQKQKVHNTWFKHLSQISKIGVENAAIFNPEDGTVTGKGGQFIIDRSLLPKLKFIKEGEFQEITGKPAIRVVGDAQVLTVGDVKAEKTRIETRVIHTADIIRVFLKQKKVSNPKDYIIEVCHSTTAYLPIYYYMRQAKLSLVEAVDEIKCVERCNAGVRRSLIERLSQDDPKLHYTISDTGTPTSRKRIAIKEEIDSKNLDRDFEPDELFHVFLVIRSLNKKEVDINHLFPLLLYWFNNSWDDLRGVSQTEFRKALCHLDYVLFKKRQLRRRRR